MKTKRKRGEHRHREFRYAAEPERLIFAGEGLGALGADDEVTPKKRKKARAACASGQREFAWLRIDMCLERMPGAEKKLARGGDLFVPHLDGARAVYEFVKSATAIIDRGREHFLSIPLDAKMKPLGVAVVSIGSANATLVHPRETFQPAVLLGAHAIIVVHNHPSGDPEPSEADMSLTRRLVAAGDILGVALLDHVVVGATDWYSFAEAGALRS